MKRSWVDGYSRHRFSLLFYSLLITLGISPLVKTLTTQGWVLEVFLGVNLIAATTGTGRPLRMSLLVLLAVGMRLGGLFLNESGLTTVSVALWVLLVLLAAGGALRFAIRSRRVDSEHVYAALSTYLLVGFSFAALYWTLQGLIPGQFSVHGIEAASGDLSLSQSVYFSFATLTTLGYGDIVPHSDLAQGLAMMEALIGQLYIAVMVARLVSLYIQD